LDFALNLFVQEVEDEELSEDLTIYPNPAKGYFNYLLDFQEKIDDAHVEIIDLMGKTVKIIQLKTKKGQINVSDLHGGYYFIRIRNGNKSFVMSLIIE